MKQKFIWYGLALAQVALVAVALIAYFAFRAKYPGNEGYDANESVYAYAWLGLGASSLISALFVWSGWWHVYANKEHATRRLLLLSIALVLPWLAIIAAWYIWQPVWHGV